MEKASKEIKNAAICFAGQARTFELCYPYIKKNLLDNLGSYDIFCCVEDDENASKIEVLKPVKIKKIKSSDVAPIIKDEVQSLKKQNYRTSLFIESFRFNIKNVYQQLYKINQSFGLLEEYMKEKKIRYNHFIRIRFDLLPIDSIKLADFAIEKNEIIVPKERLQHPQDTINDMICITSDFNAFKSYCSLYNNFRNVIENQFSVKMTLFQKLYFLCEKIYFNFFFFLLGKLSQKNKICRNLLGTFTHFSELFYKKFKYENKLYLEKILFHYLTSEKINIKEMKIDFIIVRSLDEGLLVFGK